MKIVDMWYVVITSEAEGRASSIENKGKFLVRATDRPAGRPWSRFWEAYISGTESPIGKRSSLVGTPIPSTVYGTNAESCQYPLWHVARATWAQSYKGGDVPTSVDQWGRK